MKLMKIKHVILEVTYAARELYHLHVLAWGACVYVWVPCYAMLQTHGFTFHPYGYILHCAKHTLKALDVQHPYRWITYLTHWLGLVKDDLIGFIHLIGWSVGSINHVIHQLVEVSLRMILNQHTNTYICRVGEMTPSRSVATILGVGFTLGLKT